MSHFVFPFKRDLLQLPTFGFALLALETLTKVRNHFLDIDENTLPEVGPKSSIVFLFNLLPCLLICV